MLFKKDSSQNRQPDAARVTVSVAHALKVEIAKPSKHLVGPAYNTLSGHAC